MKTRILTGLVFTAIILFFLLPGLLYHPIFILLMFAIVSLVGGNELYKALRLKFALPMQGLSFFYRLAMFLPLGFYYLLPSTIRYNLQNLVWEGRFSPGGESEIMAVFGAWGAYGFFALIVLLYSFLLFIVVAVKYGTQSLAQSVAVVLANLYLAFPLATVPLFLYFLPGGSQWIVIALFSPWASDVCAYFTGYLWGKKKLIPQISPKKTFAGFYGGMIGPTLLFFLFWSQNQFHFTSTLAIVVVSLLSGFLLGVGSQFGDWLASIIKRELGLKDYGQFLPGHGGMLDRFDSVLFTLPLCFFLACIYIVID